MSLQEAQEAMKGASISYPAGAFVQVPVRNAVGPLDIAAYHQGLPGALFFKIWGRPPHPQSTLTGLVAHVSYINLAGQQVEGPITFAAEQAWVVTDFNPAYPLTFTFQ